MPTKQPQADVSKTSSVKDQRSDHSFSVVGIGASAGGLEACRKLLKSLPEAPGLAFILVQHLDPTHESMLVDLLAGSTNMTVTQASDGMPIEVDHLYVIPPGTYLSAKDGKLHLSTPQARHGSRLPFDFLLQSLANTYGARSACIILSGTGADGSQGLLSIRHAGGLVLAQQFDEAGFDGMPRNAALTGSVNEILPVAAMAAALALFFKSADLVTRIDPSARTKQGEDWPHQILDLLKTITPQDLDMYKQGTVARRIARRMAMSALAPGDREGYLELLRSNTVELDLLAKDLLIHVTSFFRDTHVFNYLETSIIPTLIESHASQMPLRIWIAGCSTGEETYSLAMLFYEEIARRTEIIKIQVFASDIDPEAIAQAREGAYPGSIESDVSAERLTNFFTKEGKTYRIKPEIRASVVFTVQDILADPPFSRMDFVSCRNLLIYLRPEAQAKVIALFRFSLTEGGLLLLGKAETVGSGDGTFKIVSKSHRLYRRIGRAKSSDLGFQLTKLDPAGPLPQLSKTKMEVHNSLADLCRRTVIEIYSPAAVLINSRHECLYHLGRTDRYLRMAAGYPTHDILEMLPRTVRSKLRSAVQDTRSVTRPFALAGVCMAHDETDPRFRIIVHPILYQGTLLFLICFLDQPVAEPETARQKTAINMDRSMELEEELGATKRELQSALLELQMTSEEQRAVNEETLSVNEEYQSTNEELETSKEELQSLNEELTALNTQLQETLDRQRTTSNDLQNVLYSTNVATLFLDPSLNIRFFTPATRSLFNVIQSDVGRPIGDLTSFAEDGALSADAEIVLLNGRPVEREIEGKDGSWYLRRILPYMTTDKTVEGVVVTFANITERHNGSAALEAAKRQAEQANTAKSQFLAAASHDLRQPLQTIALIQGLIGRRRKGSRARGAT